MLVDCLAPALLGSKVINNQKPLIIYSVMSVIYLGGSFILYNYSFFLLSIAKNTFFANSNAAAIPHNIDIT